MNSNHLDFYQKKKLAAAEVTSIETLKELSKDENIVIRCLVASNPNTPVEVLKTLGAEFPEAITDNPIFDLLVLEDPESDLVRLSLARSSTTPLKTLLKLIEDKNSDIKLAAISNPNIHLEILEKIVESYEDSKKYLGLIYKNWLKTHLLMFGKL